jgi:hypothetical protein
MAVQGAFDRARYARIFNGLNGGRRSDGSLVVYMVLHHLFVSYRPWPEDFRPDAAKFDLGKIVREVLQKPGQDALGSQAGLSASDRS